MPVPPRRPARPLPGPPARGARRPDAPGAGRPARRRWSRWGARLATTLSVLVLAVGGIGHAVVTGLDTGIGRVEAFADAKNRPAAGRGTNVLLVGTDGRGKVTPAQKARYRLGGAPCNCTDTIMLVHLSEDRRRVSVVSLPRDSYVELPAHTDAATGERHGAHPLKLNAVHAEGGPGLTVRTVERMSGVKIDHYLEIDFTGFMRAVDALGGVRICTARPLKDPYTGLDLPAGTHTLDGGEALRYVRSRHVDGSSDLGRMRQQQRFVAALLDRAADGGALPDPARLRAALAAAVGSVRADRGFGTQEALELAGAVRGLTAASSEFASVPVEAAEGTRVDGVGATVRWDAAGARALFAAIREDRPLGALPAGPAPRRETVATPPGDVRVQVYNGTRVRGLGARVDAALRAAGFATTRTPYNAGRRDVARTVVSYDPARRGSAESLAAALPGARLLAVPGQGPLVKVLAGTDLAAGPVRAGAPPAARGPAGDGALTGDRIACP
ncbi:LCP family protein [Streptomyces sudanensis]|uniref:LCP family protein n=1 Tax=Streptomyces sudanensis TaxID=436397 RepID=UPI0020CBCFEF|nr:LCP family protein [Streptomyces sudanensis]MCP9987835.1 LCP family protein [Streptomyces sudanensis]